MKYGVPSGPQVRLYLTHGKWHGKNFRKETGLPAEEFSQFVRDCELEFGLSVPG